MNPAYMTRQVHELGKKDYGSRGHITSLKPLRLENAPDDWERKALTAFERGKKEVFSLEPIGAETYFRFMRPMVTGAGCLKCHAEQGYKLGDIRGGISVSMPWSPFHDTLLAQRYVIIFAYGAIWLIGITGLYLGTKRLRKYLSERMKAEEALQSQEERLNKAQEISHVGSWEMDYSTNRLIWSDEFYRIFGLEPREFPASYDAFVDFIHPDDRSAVKAAYSGSLREGRDSYEIEHRIVRKHANEVCYVSERWEHSKDASAKIVRSLGMVQDITHRKLAEIALRKSEERFRTILHTAMDGFWLLDAQGRLLEVNETYCTMSGYSAQELLAMSIDEMEVVETREQTAFHIRKVMELGRDRFESRHRRKDGTIFDVEVSVQYRNADGGQFVAFLRDITESKLAGQEKEKLQDQLLQSQKMKAIGQLAGGVPHDFNNMLAVILGHAELALNKIEPANPLYPRLEEILKAARRSAALTRQLLTFARRQPVLPKVLDMNETIEGMLKMLRRLIGEDIHFNWLPYPALWPIRIDPSQIDQILANLCVNARDAITGVGKLTIETGNIRFDEDYCTDHVDFKPGEYVMLAVSDDGCGMDGEILDKLFEPFFTTKEAGKGTGLGLATVYGIVVQNNGFIQVSSKKGHGTTFTIYLPRHTGNTGEGTTEELRESPGPGRRETVLMVEDEPSLLEINVQLLEDFGYRVLPAGTPGEAIRLANEYEGDINLLLTDVVMPEMNGRDLAAKLLPLRQNLKCLFMSGYTANIIGSQCVLDEGVHFIQKPFSRKDLASKVREVLDRER